MSNLNFKPAVQAKFEEKNCLWKYAFKGGWGEV